MRTVVSSSEVPHLWAHKAQPSATNSTRTLFFEGDRIFSYGHHFIIAEHKQNDEGQSAVLLTTRGYSVSV